MNAISILLAAATAFIASSTANAQIITCGFFVENAPNGKSNEASCAMSPEEVYSNRNYTLERWQHCDVDPAYGMIEYHDVRVDLEGRSVTWKEA
jgi:hypothetical protein